MRAAAVDAGRRAAAGRAAADDKLRLRQSQIGNEKVEALELVPLATYYVVRSTQYVASSRKSEVGGKK